MADGSGQLSPVPALRLRGGRIALSLLTALAASALLVTLGAGLSRGMEGSLDGLLYPALFTLWQALISTLLSILLAIPVALSLESLRGSRLRNTALAVFAIPLSLPAIVAVLAILTIAGRAGWLATGLEAFGIGWKPHIYGLSGIVATHVFFNMPLAVRMFASAFDGIAAEQWKLAASLNFPFAARLSVIMGPVILSASPGIAGLVFMLCAGSYSIILLMGGGPAAATLQTAIQQALTFDLDMGRAAWLTLIQLVMTFTLVMLLPNLGGVAGTNSGRNQRRWHRTGTAEQAMAVAILSAALLIVATPLLALVTTGWAGDHLRILAEPGFRRAIIASTAIALVCASLALVFAWLLAAAQSVPDRKRSGIFRTFLDRVPLMLFGLPPLILGTGWFLLSVQFTSTWLVAPLAIITANLLLALPFALQILSPALAATYRQNDRLCQTLRLSGWSRLRLADLPVMKRPLVQAFLFAFALSFGDLGVVTLFGSDQIMTFPALIHAKMGAYRTNDAAVLALYLAAFTGLLSWLALKGHAGDNH